MEHLNQAEKDAQNFNYHKAFKTWVSCEAGLQPRNRDRIQGCPWKLEAPACSLFQGKALDFFTSGGGSKVLGYWPLAKAEII